VGADDADGQAALVDAGAGDRESQTGGQGRANLLDDQ
jgi:hypothetical protein